MSSLITFSLRSRAFILRNHAVKVLTEIVKYVYFYAMLDSASWNSRAIYDAIVCVSSCGNDGSGHSSLVRI